jgi:hypothetical protein
LLVIEPTFPRNLSLGAGNHVSVVRTNVSARTPHTVGNHVDLDSRRVPRLTENRSQGLQLLRMRLNWASLPLCSAPSSLCATTRSTSALGLPLSATTTSPAPPSTPSLTDYHFAATAMPSFLAVAIPSCPDISLPACCSTHYLVHQRSLPYTAPRSALPAPPRAATISTPTDLHTLPPAMCTSTAPWLSAPSSCASVSPTWFLLSTPHATLTSAGLHHLQLLDYMLGTCPSLTPSTLHLPPTLAPTTHPKTSPSTTDLSLPLCGSVHICVFFPRLCLEG